MKMRSSKPSRRTSPSLQHERSSPIDPSPRISWVLIHFWLSLKLAAVMRRWQCCEALWLRPTAVARTWVLIHFFIVFWLIVSVGWWVLILIGLAFLVAVLQGTLVEADGRHEEVGFGPFFLVFWLIVGVGWWVLILIGFAFLVHWWVLMILPPIGWVMIWLGGDDGGDGGWVVMMVAVGLWEKGAVREWIIKNCKIMNILLNKCVEWINWCGFFVKVDV